MKILKILGIAAGVHALALILIFANPGCSYTKAAAPEASPISSAPGDSAPAAPAPASDTAVIRYSPTRPGTAVASALVAQPVSDVVPATTYTVAQGDSLWSIAKKSQITKADLAAANSLKTSSTLHIGQRLVIPSKASKAPAEAAAPQAQEAPSDHAAADKTSGEATRHTVKPGETLGGIARMYKVKQGDIAVANNISDPRKIQPGQELVIPFKAASAGKPAKGAKARADAGPGGAPAATGAGNDADLDAGLKPPGAAEVPVIKIDDSGSAPQPKNP